VRRLLLPGLFISCLVAGCASPASTTPVSTPTLATSPSPTQGERSPAPTARPSAAPSTALVPVRALDVRLETPLGLLLDPSGNLYVSECAYDPRSYIERIDAAGLMAPFAGTGTLAFSGDGGAATSASIACPAGMAFGPDGALYFADHANNRVRRIDAAGIISTIAGSGPAGVNQGSFSGDGGLAVEATLQEPWDVAFDRAGNLFIADRDNNRVRRVDGNGVITTVAGDGRMLATGDGGPAIDASITRPLGVTVDPMGNLLIADSGNHRVRMVDRDGSISTYAGADGGSSGDGGRANETKIAEPNDFAFEADGALIVSTGGLVRRIDSTGIISTIAGGGKAGSGQPQDGSRALDASFGDVYGIVVDAKGNVFLTDGYNSVYRIDTNGIITAFAGKRSG
jgi:sugar lactone lactonase YvrE